MSLDHAILGFLRHRSLSGYDLKSLFDQSVRHFWSADQSQIYRTLARLSEEGLATVEVVEQSDRPDRKLYHITDAGRAELSRWLKGPIPSKEPRSAVLVQLFFASELTDEEVVGMLRAQIEHWRSALATMQKIPGVSAPYLAQAASSRSQYFALLTLENGLAAVEAQIAWLEDVIGRFERGEVPAR